MLRRYVALVAALALLVPSTTLAAPKQAPTVDYAIVRLSDDPIASYEGGIEGLKRTKPTNGRLDPSSPAFRAYERFLEKGRANYRAFLAQQLPQVEVVAEYDTVFNGVAVKLNGASLQQIAAGPKADAVDNSWLYRPTMNVSNDLIRASEVWAGLGGQATAGAGVQVAVIDTGIDLTNPFFSDTGLPAQAQIDECDDQDNDPATPDTSNKVTVCRVFAAGVATTPPGQEDEPGPPGAPEELCVDHGTHVAGTIGGRAGTSGTVAGTDVVLTDLSGVAPGVTLGNYNVFPCVGAGFVAFGGSAFSHDIATALEAAVLDGMDVANLSLGGTVQGPHDFLAESVDAAVDAGMVVVAAAGNSGPGDATVESPGTAPNAITAGASTNPHFVGISVTLTAGPAAPATIGAALGDFENFDPPISADYTVTTPANGCSAITNDIDGKIALIDRGVCTFGNKISNAEAAGAVGVIVVNNVAGDPTAMGADPLFESTIPAVMVGKAEGTAMKPSGTATVDGTVQSEFLTENEDIIAGFSSRGPTPFTSQIKPDLTAPGVNVASSVFDGEFAFFQGTSMATPHLSGVAALILDEFSAASPAEVKSRMANNAARVVTDHVNGTVDPGVLARGGGRVDVVEAFDADTWFDPVSVSFGLVRGNRPSSQTQTVAVTGSGASVEGIVWFATPPAGVELTAVLSGSTLSVTLTLGRAVPNGDLSGDVVVSDTSGNTYLIPFWVRSTNRQLLEGSAGRGARRALRPTFTFTLFPAAVLITLSKLTYIRCGYTVRRWRTSEPTRL
jgi:minor extracellular serine protease Vpr